MKYEPYARKCGFAPPPSVRIVVVVLLSKQKTSAARGAKTTMRDGDLARLFAIVAAVLCCVHSEGTLVEKNYIPSCNTDSLIHLHLLVRPAYSIPHSLSTSSSTQRLSTTHINTSRRRRTVLHEAAGNNSNELVRCTYSLLVRYQTTSEAVTTASRTSSPHQTLCLSLTLRTSDATTPRINGRHDDTL